MCGSEFSWFARFSRRYFHRITVTIKMELPGILRKLHQRNNGYSAPALNERLAIMPTLADEEKI